MLKYVAWKDVELEQLNPLLDRQMIVGDKIMLARVVLKKGCVVPEHSHENEQVTYILEGALKFWIDGKQIVVHAGEVLCAAFPAKHRGVAGAGLQAGLADVADPEAARRAAGDGEGGVSAPIVVASEAKQSRLSPRKQPGLLRRFAPRNDENYPAP